MMKTLSLKQAVIILVLLVLASYSTWVLTHYAQSSVLTDVQNNHLPDAFAENVHILRTGLNGQATDELLIPRMLHYPQGNSTYFAKPLLTVFMLANKSSWRITADHGQAFQGINRIELWDNVHIQQQAENALALFTSHLTILTQTQIAQTQAPVILSQAGNQIRGTGLRADFKRGEIELLSKAQGYYAPNKR